VAIQKANINEVTLMASFNINNKNDFILPLNKVNYSISTGNTPLLSGALNNQKIIQGKNEIKIPLTLKTNQLVTNVFSLLKNPNFPLTIKVDSPLFNYKTTQTLNLSSLL
jgi:LEA14-like dessication related protein